MKINTEIGQELVRLPAVPAVKSRKIKVPTVTEMPKEDPLAEFVFADKGFRLPEGTVAVAKARTQVFAKPPENCSSTKEYGNADVCWARSYPPHHTIKDSLEDTHCWNSEKSSGLGKRLFVVRPKRTARNCHWWND
jgi:hypothetical protein